MTVERVNKDRTFRYPLGSQSREITALTMRESPSGDYQAESRCLWRPIGPGLPVGQS